MSDELKPCPFCGGVADHSVGKTGEGKQWHYVECTDCGAMGPTPPYADHNVAVIECRAEQWNTRADTGPDALIRAVLDAAATVAQSKHDAAIKWAKVYVPSHDGQTDSGLIADEIRALADDPDFIARITKAAEWRG